MSDRDPQTVIEAQYRVERLNSDGEWSSASPKVSNLQFAVEIARNLLVEQETVRVLGRQIKVGAWIEYSLND